MSLLASYSSGDLSTLFTVLAIVAFAVAIYLGFVGNWIGAIVLAFIGLLILLAQRPMLALAHVLADEDVNSWPEAVAWLGLMAFAAFVLWLVFR